MSAAGYNLAIETATPPGSVALGRGDELIESRGLPELAKPRHRVDLMPTIDGLCREHGVGAADVGELYVSIGPGSFTGLRIAVATVKGLAQVTGAKVAAVPTLDALASNVSGVDEGIAGGDQRLVVCLARKRETVYGGVYRWEDGGWMIEGEAGVCGLETLIERAGAGVVVLGDPLPELNGELESVVTVLAKGLAVARAEAVWRIGRGMSRSGRWVDPVCLEPLYARPPEAVELWDKRHGDTGVGKG